MSQIEMSLFRVAANKAVPLMEEVAARTVDLTLSTFHSSSRSVDHLPVSLTPGHL